MLLVLGDSYADHLRSRSMPTGLVSTYGWRGACVGDDAFRIWAIRQAVLLRPRRVMLMVGGNDLAKPLFRPRLLFSQLRELALGLLAAGADSILILPLPPRVRLRGNDVSPGRYQRRRWMANRLLRHKFRRPPVVCVDFVHHASFLSADGVHPSETGWCAMVACVRAHVA